MQSEFLHISLNFKRDIDEPALRAKFDLALDWVHYMPNCWIVKTTSSIDKWYDRLIPFIEEGDSILIVKIDFANHAYSLPRAVADTIDEMSKPGKRMIRFTRKSSTSDQQ